MSAATPSNDKPSSDSSTVSELDVAVRLEASTQALATGNHDRGLAHARAALAAAASDGERAKALSLVSLHAWRLGNLILSYEAGHDRWTPGTAQTRWPRAARCARSPWCAPRSAPTVRV